MDVLSHSYTDAVFVRDCILRQNDYNVLDVNVVLNDHGRYTLEVLLLDHDENWPRQIWIFPVSIRVATLVG